MPTSTPNMGLSKPTEGGETGTWDTELNNSLDTVDAHDHTSGKGVQVPSAGININADLSFAGFELLDCAGLELSAVAAADQKNTLYLSSVDNELYWRDNSNNTVKITNGGAINLTGVGGFTGDYGAGTEQANYSNANKLYNFTFDGSDRAKVDCSDIRLFEYNVGATTAVKLKSPTGLASSYDWIYPTALPSSGTEFVVVNSSGQLDTRTTQGVPGTTYTMQVHALSGNPGGSSDSWTDGFSQDSVARIDATTSKWHIPINLPLGARIREVRGLVKDNSTGTTTVSMELISHLVGTGESQIGSTQTSSGAGTDQTLTLGSLTTTIAASTFYSADFTVSANNACDIYGIEVDYDYT